MSTPAALRIGLIADTHGLLRPEARAFLAGCDYIVHGGDIGRAEILDELGAMAPLIAIRGNNDTAPWAAALPQTELVRMGGIFVYVIHNLAELAIEPAARGVRAIISGHSHIPRVAEKDGVLYVNPGSCGPRRFKLPICIGELLLTGSRLSARVVDLIGGVDVATTTVM
ncbi:MAG TPA: metallophosphoesterase family protein [Steroidobacteraceae bacterium]